jgi:hypothetical protein
MSEHNNKTPAVNGIGAAERARHVSTDEVERHFEENSRGSPLPPVSKSYGLSSLGIEGPNTLEAPPQSPGTTSHVVNQSASSDHQITSTLTSQEPPKIKLFLQKADGEIDFQNPLSSREFKDATIPEFFAIFSKRSGLDASLLHSLNFIVVFAHNLLFEVNRGDDERKWLNLKRRISHLFKEAMAERQQENEFEVRVVEDNEFEVRVVEDNDLAGL